MTRGILNFSRMDTNAKNLSLRLDNLFSLLFCILCGDGLKSFGRGQ